MKEIIILSLCLLCMCASEKSGKGEKLTLTVFYESYSQQSIDFFIHQLYPTWVKLSDYIRLELVPFGLAEQPGLLDGTNNITCAHGEKECKADMLHACAIHKACHGRATLYCKAPQLRQAMEYIFCTMQAENQEKASDECAETAVLRYWGINKCARQQAGIRLASHYINDPRRFKVEYVPYISVNGKHSEEQQKEGQENLTKMVCNLIKDQCSQNPESCKVCENLSSRLDV